MSLQYHPAQVEVQEEANTRPVAEMLSHWAGPVEEFACDADLVVLAATNPEGRLHFAAACGEPPLVQVLGPAELRLPDLGRSFVTEEGLIGGLAVNLGQRRRARLNGQLHHSDGSCVLEAHEAFVNCRKYIAPSIARQVERRVGPLSSTQIGPDDPWLASVLGNAETAFLASIAPNGQPDVSHRGGPPGFLSIEGGQSRLSWPEFVGDGMFKTAGNIRGTSTATLLVLDLETGDAAELAGEATYQTLRTAKQAREDALQQHRDPHSGTDGTFDHGSPPADRRVQSPRSGQGCGEADLVLSD